MQNCCPVCILPDREALLVLRFEFTLGGIPRSIRSTTESGSGLGLSVCSMGVSASARVLILQVVIARSQFATTGNDNEQVLALAEPVPFLLTNCLDLLLLLGVNCTLWEL